MHEPDGPTRHGPCIRTARARSPRRLCIRYVKERMKRIIGTPPRLFILLLALIFAIGTAIFFFRASQTLRVLDVTWTCERNMRESKCQVTFQIQNRSDSYHNARIAILGQRRSGGSGKRARLDSVGETHITERIEPHEKRALAVPVTFTGNPDFVQVIAKEE